MASEEAGERVAVAVPEDVRSWLRRRATERGVDLETYVYEVLVAHRAVDEELEGDGEVPRSRPVDAATLDDRVEEAEVEFRELLEDVRQRVIQVKRETDQKAPAEHDHPELATDVEDLEATVEAVEADLAAVEATLESLREDVDDGFENFEAILDHLIETTDRTSERVDRLARATLDSRDRVEELEAERVQRDRVDELKRDAALEGVETAPCGECGKSIRAALLTTPRCPYCSAGLVDVEGKQGLFGSATFVTGDHPALSPGSGDDLTDDIEASLEEPARDPGDVDWDSATIEDP